MTARTKILFTQKMVDTWPLGQDGVAWVAGAAGLGLRVQAGRKSWVVRYRAASAQRQATLPGDLSLKEARGRAAVIRADASEGKDRMAARRAAKRLDEGRKQRTLERIMPLYLAHVEKEQAEGKKSPSYVRELRRYLNRDWKPFHKHDADALDPNALLDELDKIAEKHPTAANRAHSALSSCLSFGRERRILSRDINVKRLQKRNSRERFLNDDELRAVWLGSGNEEYGRIVKLLILTGQRREEVGAMQWGELDLAKGIWHLPDTRTKNGRPHDVPLSLQVLAILASITPKDGSPYLFGRNGKSFQGWSASKVALSARVELATPFVLHDLRRSFVTGMCELGIPPHVVEACVNHVSGHKSGVAGVYNKASYASEKTAAMQAWGNHVERVVSGELASNIVAYR